MIATNSHRSAFARSVISSLAMIALLSFSAESLAQLPAVGDTGGKNCRNVGTVKGSSGFGKHADWQKIAKYKALKQAEAINAHHVVWSTVHGTGAFNGEVTALAFSCD
ncbi:MAG: hypothetical protein U1E83_07745 [Methylotetracoccus sp.]